MKVTLEGIKAKIKGETYLVLPDGRTTLCQLTLENGYTINGYSACVDESEFNRDLGRKYAFESALSQIWPLEGYLLAEKMYWDRAQPVATKPRKRITLNAMQAELIKSVAKKPHWTQTPEGKKILAKRKRRSEKA